MATVDARPIIAAGAEPFEELMAAAGALGEGGDLVVLAPFEPVPRRESWHPRASSTGRRR